MCIPISLFIVCLLAVFMLGGTAGVMVMCLMFVAKEADRELHNEDSEGGNNGGN